jgi:hypothetical protein
VIDGVRDRLQIGVGLLAEDFFAAGIDRDDSAGVAVLAQEALRARGVLARVAGSTDQRDGFWRKEGLCKLCVGKSVFHRSLGVNG